MARLIEGTDRRQAALLPESLDDYVDVDNSVRVVDVFVDALDLTELGFDGVAPETTGRLAPDFRTIADFRRDNGAAIRKVCSRFVALCRDLHLLDGNTVAIDGSKFKAVNHREKNFTKGSIDEADRSHREHHRPLSQGARSRGP